VKIRQLAWTGLLVITTSAFAQPVDGSPYAELKRHQPPDVAAPIDRVIDCNHWRSEPAYDANRAAEIKEAVSSLRCDQIPNDEAETLHRHPNDKSLQQAIAAALNITL
jgi:hypothetical protein